MTQAANLGALGTNVNTSGDVSLTTGVTNALPAANGGTGLTAVGTSGNVLTSNGTTWVSSAPSGGVTSLNGQTGAITNTSLYAIGSYTFGRTQDGTNHLVNATVAGTSLYAISGFGYRSQANILWLNLGNVDGTIGAGQVLVNTGTWRCMSPAWGNNDAASGGLWVRIS